MYQYPELGSVQQNTLPVLIAPASPITARFSDSTHQLWSCNTQDGPMVLKVCHQSRVQQSTFWLGINTLFQLDFPHSLHATQQISQFLHKAGAFAVPEVIAEQARQFVLVRYMVGEDITADSVDEDCVRQLAHHLGKLHQHQSVNWGSLNNPSFNAVDWSVRLEDTLRVLAERASLPIPAKWMQQVREEIQQIRPQHFVPTMPDLRWDQLRRLENGQLAVVDLDAFVRAPRELDFVLLDYLLRPQHALAFKGTYSQYHDWPDVSTCRLTYRLLLFLMHVLGEPDLEKWLSQPVLPE